MQTMSNCNISWLSTPLGCIDKILTLVVNPDISIYQIFTYSSFLDFIAPYPFKAIELYFIDNEKKYRLITDENKTFNDFSIKHFYLSLTVSIETKDTTSDNYIKESLFFLKDFTTFSDLLSCVGDLKIPLVNYTSKEIIDFFNFFKKINPNPSDIYLNKEYVIQIIKEIANTRDGIKFLIEILKFHQFVDYKHGHFIETLVADYIFKPQLVYTFNVV